MNFEISDELVEQLSILEEKCYTLSLEGDKPEVPSKNIFFDLSGQLEAIGLFLDDPEGYIEDILNFIEEANK